MGFNSATKQLIITYAYYVKQAFLPVATLGAFPREQPVPRKFFAAHETFAGK